jgi:PAS domain S-box-containing protein/putative nucleotidyltransferase with HDIG domain
MKLGTSDYIVKDVEGGYLNLLPSVIEKVLQQRRTVEEKQQTEEALRESEEKYRRLVERANDGITIIEGGIIKYANPSLAQIWGGTIQQLIGTSFTDYIDPDDLPKVVDRYKRRMKGEDIPSLYETVLRRKDGSKVYVELNAGTITYHGKLADLVFVRDITERKRTEAELRVSEEHYRALMDNVDFGINLIDTDHTIVMANAVQNKRLSKAVSDVIGKKCFREFEKRDAVCSYCPGVRAMATSQPAEVESETIRDDGTRFPVRVQAFPIFGQDGTASGFIEVVEDITERKRAEEKLRESEGRYRTLVENIDFGINLIDAEYNVVMVNAALSKRVNKSVSELVGEKCYRVFEKRDTVCPNCPGVRAMATGQRAEVESAAPDDDPNDFSARVQAFPIFGQDGAASGFIEVVEDITERKKVQKALLEHKEALKNSFLGTTEALSKVIEDRDPYTSGHSAGVAGLAEAIAHALGFSEDQITGIYIAGVLHDIGKMAVPVEILVKPGSLNDMERSLIQIHPKAGYEILKGIDFPWPVAQATHQHHERMDGSGYPQGLKGGEIILEARILAVADVMDAMTHHRPYRPAFSLQDAIKEIKKGRGSLYDPRVVDACLEVLRGKEPWIISEYSTNSTSPHFPSRSKNSSVLPITTSMRASGRR